MRDMIKIQQPKMKELWDNKDDDNWEKVYFNQTKIKREKSTLKLLDA